MATKTILHHLTINNAQNQSMGDSPLKQLETLTVAKIIQIADMYVKQPTPVQNILTKWFEL